MPRTNAIQRYFQKNAIVKYSKQFPRDKRNVRLSEAKTAAVLFKYNGNTEFELIKDFLKELSARDLKVFALGYIENIKAFKGKDLLGNINYYNNKELNWYHKPESETVTNFMKEEFDLLFNFSRNELYPIRYVAELSKAHFKIGLKETLNSGTDFTINSPENDLKYIFEQALFYLDKI